MVVRKPRKTYSALPNPQEMDALRQEDSGYVLAKTKPVDFLNSRQQAIYSIARKYHLDADELYQEAYEVLLTCLRDYTPVVEQGKGSFIAVMFTTFFGNRTETRAMEMRNRDPEYQARAAYTADMDPEEKEAFRKDPPLLVQHLDHESVLQESLENEVYEARAGSSVDVAMKIMRDSFFEKKINELVAKETDEKKRAALMHVKVGGVYNFQEIAYHFGVTDSRASQVMNELMDAFYIQRMIDGDLEKVARDFDKLKFNEKRIQRLVFDAMGNAARERAERIASIFNGVKGVAQQLQKSIDKPHKAEEGQKTVKPGRKSSDYRAPAYEDLFTKEENRLYPLVGVEVRPIETLQFIEMDFRPPEVESQREQFIEMFKSVDKSLYPALVSEDGTVIDGAWRIQAALENGDESYVCITRKIKDPLDKKILRIQINHRIHKPKKIDLYYAIGALADEGLSQQKISDALGTSRTNVLVYAKVRDKASNKLRALFEDGLIQITNASTCVDLDENLQDRIAVFIRRNGQQWSKGSKFNQLYMAAAQGTLDKLEQKVSPAASHAVEEKEADTPVIISQGGANTKLVAAMESRMRSYEQALKDNEVWGAQRESVITSQREELDKALSDIEGLKKELDAAELMRFGDPKAIENELEALKRYYAVTERLSGAIHALTMAARDIKRISLKRNQGVEINGLMESLEEAVNRFRVEVYNRGVKKEMPGQALQNKN